ncbi:nuclear transport factor 2 family protein [Nocardioides piscis]|uniref:Nuclear transport factor 2 family protein n=1 Tax=Nocardioides piscis TaxID=2714938 RepID=A0A6G7YH77_9ACTN|nr:nuclear transport factor 2 family protein [Nocardioides piscis]QIK76153.1 nuclear transport factor 2 family protein [Nocardioides piscis]
MSDERLSALEARLQVLEDERDIARLIAAYGPLVDAGAAQEVAALWTDDGVYDVDEVYLEGIESIAKMVESSAHQAWIRGGCAHVVGPPRITVDGDEAVAVCHSLMVVHTEAGFVVRRATANHWQLRRTAAGWRATIRTNRILDGRDESPALLASGARGQRP